MFIVFAIYESTMSGLNSTWLLGRVERNERFRLPPVFPSWESAGAFGLVTPFVLCDYIYLKKVGKAFGGGGKKIQNIDMELRAIPMRCMWLSPRLFVVQAILGLLYGSRE
jgi:hypothetical protein